MEPQPTRFALDAETARRIVADDPTLGARRALVGPAVLRSEVLSMLYREARVGLLDDREARSQLTGLATLRIRLLGDRVSRATAWRIARQLAWDDVRLAEYLAVASLQADVIVTADERLIAAADGIIPVSSYEELLT
ncbi:type II toxin-antitoxin system VapC family toxin [Arthrobacter woluwensis]|jgi:predicted nucleic acid-binding protein|uniref:type II toxin-antitoxin system VapC family toxin n=1 Tax=Arthrobacter woluwensis TaxID=156980 RepID=UPI001AAF792D|nr:hypothetical protein [Arthrobacter woluwensis]QTF71159.1 type II toxin-antitoxin system VapC family toxin [Arthrobacter woluwensis]